MLRRIDAGCGWMVYLKGQLVARDIPRAVVVYVEGQAGGDIRQEQGRAIEAGQLNTIQQYCRAQHEACPLIRRQKRGIVVEADPESSGREPFGPQATQGFLFCQDGCEQAGVIAVGTGINQHRLARHICDDRSKDGRGVRVPVSAVRYPGPEFLIPFISIRGVRQHELGVIVCDRLREGDRLDRRLAAEGLPLWNSRRRNPVAASKEHDETAIDESDNEGVSDVVRTEQPPEVKLDAFFLLLVWAVRLSETGVYSCSELRP